MAKTNLELAREQLDAFEAFVKQEELEEAKKKKKPYDSATVTTGCIGYNLDQFNKRAGTYVGNDNNNPSTEEAKAAAKAAEEAAADANAGVTDGASNAASDGAISGGESSGDASASAGGEGGGMGESFQRAIQEALEEAKLFIPKLARGQDADIQRATIDIPDRIKILDQNTVEHEISILSPEEKFTVGYVTPVYFYDELWDKFMLIKCTTLTGYTGLDYREVRAVDDQGNEYAGHEDRLAKAQKQIDNPTVDGNDRVKRIDSQTPKTYTHVNKIVDQGDIVYKDEQGNWVNHVKNHTILYYPDFNLRPKVTYYIDMHNGKGYFKVSREVLEKTIIDYVLGLLADPNFDKSNRWTTDSLRKKILKTLETDFATQADQTLSSQRVWEPTADKMVDNQHVNKPQVRALYTGQIFYLDTPYTTLGTPLKEEMTEEQVEEALVTEAKRETRRYYIRPQGIFCANKAEVIRALIAVGDENCSVYTLKGLGDNRDIHKLTNKDIIYYYDDHVLYDKNHVQVMDYDLYIKHEEERKKFPGDIDNVSGAAFIDAYDDRITDITGPGLEDQVKEDFTLTEDYNPFSEDFDSYNAFGEKLTEGKDDKYTCCICGEECVGYGNNPEPVKHEGKCCDACNLKFVIPARVEATIDSWKPEED